MDLSSLDALENRLKYLEEALYPSSLIGNDNERYEDVGKQISNISNFLKNEKVSTVLKKAEEAQKFMESAGDEAEELIPDSVKQEIVLSKAEDFQQAVGLLTKLDELGPLLDSKAIQDISGTEGDLSKILSLHSLNDEKFEKLTGQVVTLVKNYNTLVNHLSTSLEELEAKVVKLETDASASLIKGAVN